MRLRRHRQTLAELECNGVDGNHLGSGCSDPYSAGLNGDQNQHRFACLGQSFHRIFPLEETHKRLQTTTTATVMT